MIESPGITLDTEPSGSWQVEGPLSPRVEQLIASLQERLLAEGKRVPPARIRIFEAPAEHVGLGVGTQISLAIASVVLRQAGINEPSIEELARLTGRGDRSGIGLHGFLHGGLIVDGGRKSGTGIPPLVARLEFPQDWSIVVVQPTGLHGLHGTDESRAFAQLPPIAEHLTDRLCRIVLLEILPAVLERDLPAFSAGLSELQAQVGAIFAPVQGGLYTTPRAETIVEELRRGGFVGTGQSSWGPTLYGFSDRPIDEVSRRADQLHRRLMSECASVLLTKADNRGAKLVPEH
jgi:beta-RFAP synthase